MSDTFRVYRPAKQLKKAMNDARGETKLETWIDHAIQLRLNVTIEVLRNIGIEAQKSASPARWPISDANLDKLRKASNATGIPAQTLLLACLAQVCESTESQGKGSTKKTSVKPRRTTKAKGTPRKATPKAKKTTRRKGQVAK